MRNRASGWVGAAAAWLAGLFLVGSAGCTSVNSGRSIDVSAIMPGKTTKDDVVKAYGAPDVIRWRRDFQILSYRSSRTTGAGVGVAAYGARLAIGHDHLGRDMVHVVLRPDRVVETVHASLQSPNIHRKVWPF